jgi:hypothetical protein
MSFISRFSTTKSAERGSDRGRRVENDTKESRHIDRSFPFFLTDLMG